MPRKNKYQHIYRVDNRREHGWRVVIKRVGCSVQKCFPDHGNRQEALGGAVEFRDAFLNQATPPYWVIRPRVSCGVFERSRGKKRVVTVHVPLVLQPIFGDCLNYPFASEAARRTSWQEARQFRTALVRAAEAHFPEHRKSRRWPPGL